MLNYLASEDTTMMSNTHRSDCHQHSESMQHHGLHMQGARSMECLSNQRETAGVAKQKEPAQFNIADLECTKRRKSNGLKSE